MVWQTPKKNWASADVPAPSDFNRIEGNESQLRTDLDTHTAATTGVHGATSAATPNTIIQRDVVGRAKVAAPAAADDIARKAEVDAILSDAAAGTGEFAKYIRDIAVQMPGTTDWDTLDKSGFYKLSGGVDQHAPVDGADHDVIHIQAPNGDATQISFADPNRAFFRVKDNTSSGFQEWREFSIKSDYIRQPGYAAATGTANAYAVTLNPAPTAYVEGMAVAVKINVDNTGAATINVNGLGAKPIKKPNGSDVSAGNLKAGSVYTLRYNGTNFILQGEGGLDTFFGDGSDGDFNSTGNVTFSATLHSGLIVKQYRSFRLNAGHTMTVNNPCRGLVIYVQEDCIIDGTIDMSQKAGLAPNGEIVPMLITKDIMQYYRLTTTLQALKGGAGGNGGYGGSTLATDTSGRQTSVGIGGGGRQNLGGFGGGGSGGGLDFGNKGGIGGSITFAELGGGDSEQLIRSASNISGRNGMFGSGATGAVSLTTGSTAGKGGKCNGGGGGGSGAGSSGSSSAGGDGAPAGGFICIIVGGNMTLNGTIRANGGNGGNGSASVGTGGTGGSGGGGGGGGAGGGVIAVYYRGTFTNNGTLQVNGGSGGSGGAGSGSGEAGGPGQSGSVGTVHVEQIA
jgi:hypothetical protein